MTQPGVFITRQIPQAGLDLLAPHVEMEIWPAELPPPFEVLVEKVRGRQGLLCLLTDRVNQQVIDAGNELKVISQYAVGFDNIDVQAATARGIPVGNTPDVLTEATADFTWALLMAAARRVVEGDRLTRAGGWKTWGPQVLLGPEIAGATLGIVGFGRIGQAVARRAAGFGMRILYCNPEPEPAAGQRLKATYVSFEQLLAEADFITLHTTLSAQTFHLVGSPQFALMKPAAILINTARGSVVDQPALYRALKERVIACAAIDVTEQEPIPPDDPLLTLDNLVITPHIASASVQARTKMAVMAADNLLAGLRGEKLPNCVNPQVYP